MKNISNNKNFLAQKAQKGAENGYNAYDFDTAWTPCEPVVKALAAMFPDTKIHYSYYEENDCYCGKQEFENGRMTYCADGEY